MCEYTNDNYDLDYTGGCNRSNGNRGANEYSEYNSCSTSNGVSSGNEYNSGNEFNGCNVGENRQQGQVKRYNKNYSINGGNYEVANKNYYNNHYSRYNNYYVKEYNYVKSYVRDYNIYHYSTQTINNGCEYLGATNIVANDSGSNSSCGCSCGR